MADSIKSPFLTATPEKHAPSAPSHHDLTATPQSLPPLADATVNPAMSVPDCEKHPKGKRKRTTAKDKIVLEEAYSNNAKPDKQARLDIVQRVSLSEKEVQIWFQNRRQNDRRKSRPLSPGEVARLHQYANMHPLTSDPITSTTTPSKPEHSFPVSEPSVSRFADSLSAPPRRFDQTPSMPRFQSDLVNSTPASLGHDRGFRFYPDVTPNRIDPGLSHESRDVSHSLSSSVSSNVGYLANRWNSGASSFSTPAAFTRSGDDSFRFDSFPPSSCTPDRSSLSQSQSKVHLSTSLEGKAELVSSQETPSREMPPRPSSTTPNLPQVRRGLPRSQSAVPSITLPPLSELTSSLPPRLMRGRSRDVHAWESCADAENRDELTAQAEYESNGSAAAAINILRSTSGILQPSTAKRNAPMTKPQRPHQAKKARLDPTGSSISRLEMESETEKADREHGKVKVSMLVSPTGGDSDKENLSPDEESSSPDPYHRRPLPPAPKPLGDNPRRGRVLQEQRSPNLLSNRANTAPTRPRSIIKEGLEIFEDRMKPVMPREHDVDKIMRGAVSPSKKPDMDCVAGLLSLSQGAWR